MTPSVGGASAPEPDGIPSFAGDDLAVVDWDSLRRRMAGFGDLAKRVVAVSRSQFPGFVRSIREQLDAGDPTVSRTIHGLKGICLNIEARRVALLLERLEQLAEEGAFDQARWLAGLLPAELEELDQAMSKGIPWG